MLETLRGHRRVIAGAICALFLTAGPANAEDVWLQDGLALKDQPNIARSGAFGVMQIATTEPEQLIAAWGKPTPAVAMVGATTARRNQPIVTFIIFTGCRADASGACNVTVEYNTLDPAGKAYAPPMSAEVWVGRPAPPDRALELSVSNYGMVFEDKDPLGAYRVKATVTDHVAGLTLHTEQKLVAVVDK